MKNILLLARYDSKALGGQAKFATELGDELSGEFNVHYLSPPYRLAVSRFIRVLYFFKMFFLLPFKLFKHNIQLVHIFTACNRLALYEKIILGCFAKIFCRKVVFNFRDAIEINRQNYTKIEWRIVINMLNRFDVILSQYKKQNVFLEQEGIKKDKLHYIYNGICINDLNLTFPSIKKDFVDILFIGEVGKRKGVKIILETINKIMLSNRDITDNNFKISIYGPEFSKGYKDNCKEYIRKNNLESFLKISPPIYGDKKYRRLSECDIFLLPSYSEGFPNAVLEAMLYSKPVITTDVGALDEVIQNKIHGLKTPPGNVDALAEKILELVKNQSLRNELGKQAHKLIQEKFTLKKVTKEFSTLYKSLIK